MMNLLGIQDLTYCEEQAGNGLMDDQLLSSSKEVISSTKKCACRGIRRCGHCKDLSQVKSVQLEAQSLKTISHLNYCFLCGKASLNRHLNSCEFDVNSVSLAIDRMFIWYDFISSEEESTLLREIDKRKWVDSQSGRRKQDYGPKVNFKRQKINPLVFSGLPLFCEFILNRMRLLPELQTFRCVELCNLEYCSFRESCIDPHTDDAWLWGERLVTLNLLSSSSLTLTPVKWNPDAPVPSVEVQMPRRSLFMMMGDARFIWNHAINSQNVKDKRIAMTFRELSTEFLSGAHADIGKTLLNIAESFSGDVVN